MQCQRYFIDKPSITFESTKHVVVRANKLESDIGFFIGGIRRPLKVSARRRADRKTRRVVTPCARGAGDISFSMSRGGAELILRVTPIAPAPPNARGYRLRCRALDAEIPTESHRRLLPSRTPDARPKSPGRYSIIRE